jgi:hypothetical protein
MKSNSLATAAKPFLSTQVFIDQEARKEAQKLVQDWSYFIVTLRPWSNPQVSL